MGRTNPTFRDLLDATEDRWGDYRRALRVQERGHFDQLFEHARAHADAAGYLNTTDPVIPMLVSMLLEHQRALADQEDQLAELQEQLDDLEEQVDGPAEQLADLERQWGTREGQLESVDGTPGTKPATDPATRDTGEGHGLQD